METRNLYYVLCVAEHKSISKAAEKLFISQPTLSQHINKFEKSLGIKLFDRTTTPLSLTYAGERFIEIASNILNFEKQLTQEMQDINGFCKGRLIIGISAIHGRSLLPVILPKYKDRFPGIEIVLVEENAYKLEELAEHDKTDITITTLPIQNEQLAYQTLILDEVVMVVPENLLSTKFNKEKYNNYDKFTYQEIEMSQFNDTPYLLLKQGHRLRQVSDEILDAENIKPKIALESISIETLYQLTTIGMGITFIPKSLIPKQNINTEQLPLYFFKLRNPVADFSMVAIYNKYRCLSMAAQKFISLIKELQ